MCLVVVRGIGEAGGGVCVWWLWGGRVCLVGGRVCLVVVCVWWAWCLVGVCLVVVCLVVVCLVGVGGVCVWWACVWWAWGACVSGGRRGVKEAARVRERDLRLVN